MKVLFYMSILMLSFSLAGYGKDSTPETDGNANRDNNILNCTVSGDRGGSYKSVGKDVRIAFFSVKDNVVDAFSVGFRNSKGESMMTGMFTLDLNSRSEQEGSELGSFAFSDSHNWKDEFDSQFYPLYYDTNADSKDSKTYLTLTKAEKLKGGYLHLAGRFKFNASNNVPFEEMPEACLLDAFGHPDRKPTYLAKLAGTSQIHVSGDFDVVVLVRLTDW